MSTVTLQDVLGGPNLCGVIQGTTTGIANSFPPGFYQVDRTVDRDTGTYTRCHGTRTVARLAAYGSPSQQRSLVGLETVPVKLIHAVESILLPVADYMNLVDYDDPATQQRGIAEVTRQVRAFRANFDNLRVAALTSLLFHGAIYADARGNLLPSAEGARTVATFDVPAGHTGQLDVDGSGSTLLTTSWDDPAADIDRQVLNLRQAAARVSGYPLRCAFYGRNVASYLAVNQRLRPVMDATARVATANDGAAYLATAEVPSPLLGLQWRPAHDAHFEDAAGVLRPLVGDDQVCFTPDPTPDWIGWLEGTYPVPTTLGTVAPDAAAAVRGSVTTAAGLFAYGLLSADPVTVKMVAGDTFLPVLKVPKAIYIGTVTF